MKYSLLLIATLFSFSVIAQNDPAAKKVLDGVGAKVKAAKGIIANCQLVSISSKGKQTGTKTITVSIQGKTFQKSICSSIRQKAVLHVLKSWTRATM